MIIINEKKLLKKYIFWKRFHTLEETGFSFNLLLVAIDCEGNLQNNATCEKPKIAPNKFGI